MAPENFFLTLISDLPPLKVEEPDDVLIVIMYKHILYTS